MCGLRHVLCHLRTSVSTIPAFARNDVLFFPQKQGYKIDKTVLKLMQELKEGGRVNVAVKPVCIFLFKDGECDRDLLRLRRRYLTSPPINRYRHLDPS